MDGDGDRGMRMWIGIEVFGIGIGIGIWDLDLDWHWDMGIICVKGRFGGELAEYHIWDSSENWRFKENRSSSTYGILLRMGDSRRMGLIPPISFTSQSAIGGRIGLVPPLGFIIVFAIGRGVDSGPFACSRQANEGGHLRCGLPAGTGADSTSCWILVYFLI